MLAEIRRPEFPNPSEQAAWQLGYDIACAFSRPDGRPALGGTREGAEAVATPTSPRFKRVLANAFDRVEMTREERRAFARGVFWRVVELDSEREDSGRFVNRMLKATG